MAIREEWLSSQTASASRSDQRRTQPSSCSAFDRSPQLRRTSPARSGSKSGSMDDPSSSFSTLISVRIDVSLAGADVENASPNLRRAGCEEKGVEDVFYVREIARLGAVAVNGRRAPI